MLPIAFAISAVAIADMPCRERRAGTVGLAYSAPLLKERFVWWNVIATSLVAVAILAVPLARALFTHPVTVAPLGIGIVYLSAAATLLGVVSSNPKTFIVIFLTFWYVVTNDNGASPVLDFAGFYGTATPLVTLSYAVGAVVLLVLCEAEHMVRLRREH